MRQRLALYHSEDIGAFCGVALEKLHASGSVVEQIPHQNCSAGGASGWCTLSDNAGIQMQGGTGNSSRFTGQQINAGDRGDSGECFSSKSKGMDIAKIVFCGDLAGSMAQECDFCILTGHAAAIVRHP